jgi:hypothetical protein
MDVRPASSVLLTSSSRQIDTAGYQMSSEMTDDELMKAVDSEIAHIWMVRTFLKHSDEAAEDEELASVHRDLYDFMLALGPALDEGNSGQYLKLAKKKLGKLRRACELFQEIQPEVSGHMNFQMSARSLTKAVDKIIQLLT